MGDWMLVADTETWQAKTLHNFVKDPLMKTILPGADFRKRRVCSASSTP